MQMFVLIVHNQTGDNQINQNKYKHYYFLRVFKLKNTSLIDGGLGANRASTVIKY